MNAKRLFAVYTLGRGFQRNVQGRFKRRLGVGSRSQPLTVSNFIDQHPMSGFQIWTVLLCGFVLVLDGFDAQVIGFLTPSIAKSTGIPLHTFGPILSASLVGLMVAAMATGPIADRWGRRWPIILSAFCFGVFSLLTAREQSSTMEPEQSSRLSLRKT